MYAEVLILHAFTPRTTHSVAPQHFKVCDQFWMAAVNWLHLKAHNVSRPYPLTPDLMLITGTT